MCFTEFLGYTCGHTSVPVKRPCPMTTQSHVNPVCPSPACRPLLALTMCPSCARIVHGRWVDIVVHEHEFMHVRGACSCPVRFPYSQQPRVVSHQADYNNDVEGMDREAFIAHFRSQSTANESDGSGSSSLTIVPARKDDQQTPSNTSDSFHFSPAAAEFTPSEPAHPYGPLTPMMVSELFDIPPEFNFGLNSQYHHTDSNPTGSPVNVEPYGYDSPENGNNDAQSADKGKGKEIATGQESLDRGYLADHQDGDASQTSLYPRSASVATSATMATSSLNNSNLPPMIEPREGPNHTPEFATRMMSQYGAEWLTEHRQRHESGECDCRCSFARYHGQYMHMLAEQTQEDVTPEEMNHDFADFSFSYEFAEQQQEQQQQQQEQFDNAFSVDVSQRFDEMSYGTPGFHSDGYVLAPTNSPTEAAVLNYAPFAGDFSEELSRAMNEYFNPDLPVVPTVPSSPFPAVPAPTVTPYDANMWKWDELTLDPNAFGQPARWACAPPPEYGFSYDNFGGSSMQNPRPVDMHVIAYEVDQIPIAGLPIGAGPEGDSHMPPFEECELFYPKLRPDQRGATF
ncbi:hypothetical protein F5B19DRAFT_406096 [Rostrohypoxylon terebratum]|nr:hypothetical protein F5B19DRAFT_406096 [Rostrohypoxylon terebratum]